MIKIYSLGFLTLGGNSGAFPFISTLASLSGGRLKTRKSKFNI